MRVPMMNALRVRRWRSGTSQPIGDGVLYSRSLWLDETPALTGVTITTSGTVGTITVDQQGNLPVIPVSPGNLATAQSIFTIGGVDYPCTSWDGHTVCVLTGVPNVTAQAFQLRTLRRYSVFVPGTSSGVTPPYASMVYHTGSGGNGRGFLGFDFTAVTGELPQYIGVAPAITGGTVSPFGIDHWPCLTMFPQPAAGNQGTSENPRLLDAIRAATELEWPCDAKKRYWAGISYGGFMGLSYAAAHASEFAGVVALSACTCVGATHFWAKNMAEGYEAAHPTSGNAQTDADTARAWQADQFASNNVWLRQGWGDLDYGTTFFKTDIVGDVLSGDATLNAYDGDLKIMKAAYARYGLTNSNLATSRYYGAVNEPSFTLLSGLSWDHVGTYQTWTAQRAAVWVNLLAQSRP